MLVFALDDPAAAEPALERALAADACPAVVAPHASGGRELLCAVVDAADRDPIDVAADARRALVKERGAVRAAASRPAPPEQLRRSFHEARCALEATALRQRQRRPRSPPGATSAPSPCCSRSRTTRR